MTTIPDVTVPTGVASTPVTVTAPAESVAVPARSITGTGGVWHVGEQDGDGARAGGGKKVVELYTCGQNADPARPNPDLFLDFRTRASPRCLWLAVHAATLPQMLRAHGQSSVVG